MQGGRGITLSEGEVVGIKEVGEEDIRVVELVLVEVGQTKLLKEFLMGCQGLLETLLCRER